jgi:imidazolonepropionase-like amidohydrolase
MRRYIALLAGAVLGLIAAGAPAAPSLAATDVTRSGSDVTIEHVTVIDGTGAAPQPDMTVIVSGGRIVSLTPSKAAGPVRGRRLDGRGRFLIPGLIDAHIHLRGASPANSPAEGFVIDHVAAHQALASYLYAGVTSVVDLGNQPELVLKARAEERAGRILSPRIFATGNLITYPGSHGDGMAIRITDFERDRALLDRHIADQAPDIVKLTYEERGWGARPMITLLPPDLMARTLQYYNLHGIRTTVHVSSERRALEAVAAGADTLAHPVIQGPVSESFVRLMAARKTPFVTTLTIGENYSRLVEHPEYLDEPLYVASFSPAEREALKTETRTAWQTQTWTWWMKVMTPVCQDNIAKIVAAGGVAVLGTDQSNGPAAHREMELLARAGIPPLQILKIATLNGAVFLGRERDLGSISVGKLADLVLLDKDPTRDIANAKAISWVMKNGVLVDESQLPMAGGPQKRRWTGD